MQKWLNKFLLPIATSMLGMLIDPYHFSQERGEQVALYTKRSQI